MYNTCYYSEPEMNEIAEALLDIFRKNEKNDRQVAFVYLFIYLCNPWTRSDPSQSKNVFLCNSHFYILLLLLLFLLIPTIFCIYFVVVSFLPLAPVLSLLPIIQRWFSILISSFPPPPPPTPLFFFFVVMSFFCSLLFFVKLWTSIDFLTIWNFCELRIIVPLFKMLDMLFANGCFELFTQDER